MEIEFDTAKSAENKRKHGMPLAVAAQLSWDTLSYAVDDRFEYNEVRYRGLGPIGDRLYAVAFTMRGENEEIMRVISLRFATNSEIDEYVGT